MVRCRFGQKCGENGEGLHSSEKDFIRYAEMKEIYYVHSFFILYAP